MIIQCAFAHSRLCAKHFLHVLSYRLTKINYETHTIIWPPFKESRKKEKSES